MSELRILKFITVLLILFAVNLPGSAQDIETVTYHDGLQMDLYVPDGQVAGIVLFVHGGGFSGGTRQGGNGFCRNIMQMNEESEVKYAAITMSYRLLMKGKGFGCDIPAAQKKNVFLEAGRDIARATAWILDNGASHGLTTDRIILAGSSAGAEAILHAAYWEETRLAENGTRILPENFSYSGLISMAGALFDLGLITRENAIPSILFHGTCDQLVPYASAPHHYCEEEQPGYLMLHGSASIADRLESLEANYALVSECGGGHEWAGLPQNEYFRKVNLFLSTLLPYGQTFRYKEVIAGEVDCDYPDMGVCRE